MPSCDNDIIFVNEIFNIRSLSISSPHKSIKSPLKAVDEEFSPFDSDGDSGHGYSGKSSQSSRENKSPLAEEDLQPIKNVLGVKTGQENQQHFSLKMWSRMKNSRNPRRHRFPRYDEKKGPVYEGDRQARQDGGPRTGGAGIEPQISGACLRASRKSAPACLENGGKRSDSAERVKADPDAPPRTTWFKKNVADNFRCVSAPPDQRPEWAVWSDLPNDPEIQSEPLVQASDFSPPPFSDDESERKFFQEEEEEDIKPAVHDRYTVVVRASSYDAIQEIEQYCVKYGITINGGSDMMSQYGESGKQIVELKVPDFGTARRVTNKFDGARLKGCSGMLRVFIKNYQPDGPEGEPFKSDYQWRRGKRSYCELDEAPTHHELDDNLAKYFDDFKRQRAADPENERADSPPPRDSVESKDVIVID